MGVRRGQVILSPGGKEQRQAIQCSDEIDKPLDGMLEKKYWKENLPFCAGSRASLDLLSLHLFPSLQASPTLQPW